MKWIILDFGTRKLKMLRVFIDGQRFQIEDFATVDAKPDHFKGLGFPDAAAWASATISLNEVDWLKTDEDATIVCALPSSYLETRYLKFPFRNEKKIEKILNFELEAAIPFDIEEIQIRSKLLEGEGILAGKKEAVVLALTYKREQIKTFEAELRKFQLSIPPITAQVLALSALRQAVTEATAFGVLSVGHSKSEFVFMQRTGTVLGLRTFWWGGKSLTDSIAEEMKLDAVKAEQVLIRMGADDKPTPQMQESIRSFSVDFRQTLKSMQNAGIDLPKPLPIYYFGHPMRLKFISEEITNHLREYDLRLYPFPSEGFSSKQILGLEQFENIESALPALSVALAQTRIHRNKIPTFSETGFQFQRNLRKLKTGSFSILRKAAILLIAPFLYAVIAVTLQSGENRTLLKKLNEALSVTGVKMSPKDSTNTILKKLQNEVIDNRKKIDQIARSETPLSILSEVSKAIPARIKVDVKEFKVTPALITITAQTPNQQIAEQFIQALKPRYPNAKAGAIGECGEKKNECKSVTIEIERGKPT